MGAGSSKKKQRRHTDCVKQGCFGKGRDGPDFKLEQRVVQIGWVFSADHRSALVDCLEEWNGSMLVGIFEGFLCSDDDIAYTLHSSLRSGLFSEITAEDQSEPPVISPEWPVCTEWAIQQRLLRVILYGPMGTGKSSLVMRWLTDGWEECIDPTIEDSYRKEVMMPGIRGEIQIECLDTVTEEEYAALHDAWLRETDVLILCVDLSSEKPMREVCQPFLNRFEMINETDIGKGRENTMHSWDHSQCASVVLVGTKADKGRSSAVGTSGWSMSEECNIPYIECSAKCSTQVDLVFQTAVFEHWLHQRYFARR